MMMISVPVLPTLMALICSCAFMLGFIYKDEWPFVFILTPIVAVLTFFATYGICAMIG